MLKSTADQEENSEIFDLFLELLRHLDVSAVSKHVCTDIFVLELLALSGYALSAKNCVLCGKKLSENVSFSNRRGGFVCESCALKISDALKVSNSVYTLVSKHANLQSQQKDFEEIDQEGAEFSAEIHRLVVSFAKHILERDLNASELLGKL